MTDAKLREVALRYQQTFHRRAVLAREMDSHWYEEYQVPQDVIMRHCAWMVDCILEGTGMDRDKCDRWLGYVQGEMRAAGWYTIAQMREHSRG
jgi:hypothetical protein